MKFLKWLLAIVGVAGLAVAGYYLFKSWIDIRSLMYAANANKSQGFPSPINFVYLATGLAAAGGLVLGLGLGLPRRTASSIRKEATKEVGGEHTPQGFAQIPTDGNLEATQDEPVTEPLDQQDSGEPEPQAEEPKS